MKSNQTNLKELKRYEIKKKGKIESFLLTRKEAIDKGFCAMCNQYIDKNAIANNPFAFPFMCCDCSEKFYYLIAIYQKEEPGDNNNPLLSVIDMTNINDL